MPFVFVVLLAGCTRPPPAGFEQHDDRYQRCGARSQSIDNSDAVAFSGTVHAKRDETAVDGPVALVLIDGQGEPVKLVFGSLYTRPSPTPERLATYDRIRASQRGDCVRISGSRLDDGRILIETFVSYDAPAPRLDP